MNINGKKNTFQFSIDILNFGNLLNSDWDVRQFASTFTPIFVNGVDANSVPHMKFNKNLKDSYVDDFLVNSKWQMQIGLRYIFN
jgi:DNA phosphorothioation-dependent restriction protein DptG